MSNGAQLIAQRLYEAGCRFAFGIPGGEVLALVDALAQVGIEFRLAKQENAAGFMAEGTYHATGAPGILLTTLGPGVSSAANVVANAHQDKVPLICLTGCIDAAESLSYTHQIFDHQALMRPITKASLTAVDEGVDIVIDKAIALCLSDPPGPVHIDVPMAVAKGEQKSSVSRRFRRAAPVQPMAGEAMQLACEWFREAQRPLILAGLEVLNQQAQAPLAAICRRFSLPLLTTYKAKGILAEDHRLAIGAAGLSPKADTHLHSLVKASDLLVLVGYDPIEMRVGWRDVWGSEKRVIDLRTWNDVHYMHSAGVSFIGDLSASLTQLTQASKPKPVWTDKQPDRVKQALRDAFADDADFSPTTVIETARSLLPNNTVATVDAGAHRILLSQLWTCYRPHTLLQSTGLCTMGCALPLAIGYGIAETSAPVVAFVGDAGLEMVLGELATLRDSERAVIVIVFVDASLALIELKQRNLGMQNRGVDFPKTDFAAIAHALGGGGIDAYDQEQLARAIKDALVADTFTVIACHLPRQAYDGRI